MAAAPLGSLLSDTYTFCQKNWKPLVLGAVVFGTIMGVLQINMRRTMMERAGVMMQGVGLSAQDMQDLADRASQGDAVAAQKLAELGTANVGNMMTNQIGGMWNTLLPAFGISFIVSLLVGILSATYFILLALRGTQGTDAVIAGVPTYILPMVGLWIWSFLRSFAWLPFIGILFAIYYAPRFVAAPVYLIDQKKGITESVRLSIAATEYYWGKIAGNMIVFGLIWVVISLICGLVLSAIFGGSFFTPWFMAMINQIFAGSGAVFAMGIAKTVIHNPLRPAKA